MRRIDQIKLHFTRNWKFPGKERLSRWVKPSKILKENINKGIVWLTDEDIAIYTTGESYIEGMILSAGDYENEINKLIRISLKSGQNALDIGGNIGLQSIRMSQCAGKTGQVIAFEPLAYLQKKFRRNMALNNCSNVTVLPYALSNTEGTAEFTIDQNTWNQGTFSLSSKGEGSETQQVIIKVADNMAEIQELNSIALIKIDVEGFEYQVLQGLKQTLLKYRPRLIFEYDKNYWNKTEQKLSDCCVFLRKLDYTLYSITQVGCELITNPEIVPGGNIFCIPKGVED